MTPSQNDLASFARLLTRLRDDVSATRQQLFDILLCLREVLPKKEPRWFESAYGRVQSFAKYVGAPALIVAAIIPTYNLVKAIRDYDDERCVRAAYASYISGLLEHGEIERAHSLLDQWESVKTYSPALQYLRAKTSALRAIALGKASEAAEDSINILLQFHQRKQLFFFRRGKPKELFDLEVALIDIDTAFQRYGTATVRLEKVRHDSRFESITAGPAQIDLRFGRIDVLQYDYVNAEAHLTAALKQFVKMGDEVGMAEAHFELGKCFQFKTDNKRALEYYTNAKTIMERRRDELNLLKVYNNIAMIYFYEADYDHASYYYHLEEQSSRRLSDDKGLARALVNRSSIAYMRNAVPEAISLSTEAAEVFRRQGDRLGLATTLHSLANSYKKQGDTSKAIYNDKQAFLLFQDVKDLRGLAATSGGLGMLDVAGDDENTLFYLLTAISINSYTGFCQTTLGKRDTEIYTALLRSKFIKAGRTVFLQQVEAAKKRFDEIASALGPNRIDFTLPDELMQN
jgi:tetratricopeptide (TPR) repeat protein